MRIELALGPFALILHPGAQILVAFAAAAGDEETDTNAAGEPAPHFLPFPFASLAAFFCLAISSSSRYRKVFATASMVSVP